MTENGAAPLPGRDVPMNLAEPVPGDDLATSVVIPCYSDKRWVAILKAVDSVTEQQFKPVRTIIAVDHNPSLAARLRQARPHISVVENLGDMRGASSTRNAGAAATDSPIIAFLDDDETAAPDWLLRLVEPLADPTLVGTGGQYVPDWEVEKPRWFPDVFAWVVGGHYTGMPETNSLVRNVWAGNMAVRSKEFWAVGGFMAGFGKNQGSSQPEDTGLCIAMHRQSGGHWMYVPDAIIKHAVPRDRATLRFFIRRCFAEGHGKVLLRAQLPDQIDDGTLSEERLYVKRALPRGVLAELGMTAQAVSRVLAIFGGALAAALGAVTAEAQSVARRIRPGRGE